MNLLNNVQIDEVNAPVAAASSTDDNSDILDMSGYEGVVFIVPITDSAATGVAALVVEQSTANSDAAMAAVSGGSATATSVQNDDLNDTLLIVDVFRPLERYVQGVLTSATANIAFGNTVAIRYGARKAPITQGDSVSDSDLAVSPSEA